MPRDSGFVMGAISSSYHAAALAEADARVALALAVAAQDHLVAVLQEAALFAARERQRLGSPPGELDQAAAVLLLGARDRAARDQVARPQVAPVRAVVRDHLRERPVDVAQVAVAQPNGGQPPLAHRPRGEQHFEP